MNKSVLSVSMKNSFTAAATGAAILAVFSGAVVFVMSVTSFAEPRPNPPHVVTPNVSHRIVVDDLVNPWAVVVGPDDRIYVAEARGQIHVFNAQYKRVAMITGFPQLEKRGQGGLLDIAFHPQFKKNNWLYASYTMGGATTFHTRVMRFTLAKDKLTQPLVIIEGPNGTSSDAAHFGNRLVFDRAGQLYASFGERHQKEKSQELTSLHGKIVRLNDDGTIPTDNPFGAKNAIFTYGHRNPQGLDIHPETGRLFDTEHGPSGYDAEGGGDEVNILTAGSNYGWPVIHHTETANGMVTPVEEYTPAVAPSGAVFYTGKSFATWKNNFFFAALAGETLYRLKLDGNTGAPIEQERLLEEKYGRLRDVANGLNGSLLVVSTGGDLIEITPK